MVVARSPINDLIHRVCAGQFRQARRGSNESNENEKEGRIASVSANSRRVKSPRHRSADMPGHGFLTAPYCWTVANILPAEHRLLALALLLPHSAILQPQYGVPSGGQPTGAFTGVVKIISCCRSAWFTIRSRTAQS